MVLFPPMYGGIFSKKSSSWVDKFFWAIYGEVILNGRTNVQIMPRWGRSFINDKCIFQLNTVNLHLKIKL